MVEVTSKRRGKQSLEAAENTKQGIMLAATGLFAKKSFDACSIRDIANEAGVTHGVIRHHFGSKQDIWTAIAQSALQRYQAKLIPLVAQAKQSESVLDGIKYLARSFIKETFEEPEIICLMAREGAEESERAAFFRKEMLVIHKQIIPLFKLAQKESEALKKHSPDSFFLFLFSLTTVPLIIPTITRFIPIGRQNSKQMKAREELIIETLFNS